MWESGDPKVLFSAQAQQPGRRSPNTASGSGEVGVPVPHGSVQCSEAEWRLNGSKYNSVLLSYLKCLKLLKATNSRELTGGEKNLAFHVGLGDWFGLRFFGACVSLLLNAEIIQTGFFLLLIAVTLFVSRYYLNVL